MEEKMKKTINTTANGTIKANKEGLNFFKNLVAEGYEIKNEGKFYMTNEDKVYSFSPKMINLLLKNNIITKGDK